MGTQAPPNITLPERDIVEFCRRNRIRRLALFGSVLRDDFRPDSDVDMLVEFLPSRTVTYLDLASMEAELREIVGRPVDLRTPMELSRYFRDDVIRESRGIYADAAGGVGGSG